MRKAVQAARRNSRRRENNAAQSPTDVPVVSAGTVHHAPKVEAPPDPPKRKATPEEAALTAKNYRLAKELVGAHCPDYWNSELESVE
jgi:hypothetical protein